MKQVRKSGVSLADLVTISQSCTYNITSLVKRRLELSRTFSRGSSETSRTSSDMFCQSGAILN